MPLVTGTHWRAYAAGLVDGEGCVMIQKRQRARNRRPLYVAQVVINMVKRDCIEKMQFLYGGVINRKSHHNQNANGSWAWTLGGRRAQRFLDEIEPYVILKRPQVNAALWVLNSTAKDPNGKKLTAEILAIREKCWEICKEHNRRGVQNVRSSL